MFFPEMWAPTHNTTRCQNPRNYDSNKLTNKMQQFRKFYYLTFMCGSTCFGRFLAHHQELTTALSTSGFTVGA
jgi:hypothetical protein